MNGRIRIVLLAIGLGVAVAVAAWRLPPSTPSSAGRLRVVQRLHQPVGGVVPDPMQLAGDARARWRAEDVRTSWTRVQSGQSATLRSPRLELPEDFYGVIVTRSGSTRTTASALLLWSDGPTLDAAQFARNRRELPAGRETTPTVLQAGTLQSDEPRPIRHLFLHLPDGSDVVDHVETIALVTTRDLATAGAGATRLAVDGETREGFASRTPLAFRLNVPGAAELAFGLRLTGGPATIRVTQTTGAREDVLIETSVAAGRWTDFRASLRAADDTTLRFSASRSEAIDEPVYWSVPQIFAPDETTRRPNIVLYVVDALRADKLGLYGGGANASPFLDRLGAQSLVFRRAYAAASWTKPSVTTLLTSLYPVTHGIGARHYADALPPGVPTLQSELARGGYVTAQFSPNPFTGPVSSLDRGFDRALMAPALGGGKAFEVQAAQVNARLLAWIGEHRHDRYFAYVQAVDTHPPFGARGGPAGPDAYQSAIAAFDKELERLYTALERSGALDNTVIIITADHGEAFGEHGHQGHGQSVYEEEVRVPLIVYAPARLGARWVEEPVHQVDVMPTVLDLAGVAAPPDALQGRSLVSPAGSEPKPSPVFVSKFTYPNDPNATADRVEMHAVVDYPWKLIAVDRPAAPRAFELYRLDRDPGERQELSSTEAARTRQLAAALERFLQEQSAAHYRFAKANGGAVAAPAPSRELVDQLRSLGYVR